VSLRPRRVYLSVGASAVVVYLGALWNRFALDDLYIVVLNPLVRNPSGLWRAFGASYWAGNLNTTVYRPLAVASYALDWMVGSAAWFHAVNLLWHAAATVLVAALARRWAGDVAGLIAGLIFAVHPVHVEAVANVVGRNELMAATFVLLAVYAALEHGSVLWSGLAFACGLLCKENAIVTPALIAWAWLIGLRSVPERRALTRFAASWAIVGAAYFGLRYIVFRSYGEGIVAVAPVFIGQTPATVRLTALSTLSDVARLLVFPLHLRADYSPQERTAVTAVTDVRLWLGVLVVAVWGLLLAFALKRGRRLEAFGLGWIAIAYSPVANLLFPIGVLLGERTLYLPSVGLALAAGGVLQQLPARRLALTAGALFLIGGARTVLRVPVWRDNLTATASLLEDAPMSYRTYDLVGWQFLWGRQTEQALGAFMRATDLFPRDQRVYLAAADAAFTLGRFTLGDSLLARADAICPQCPASYSNQAGAARLRGDSASADSLLSHARRRRSP
jgi:hypothetical protein